MKNFLIISLVLLLVALLVVIAAFFYVSTQLQKSQLSVQTITTETVTTTNTDDTTPDSTEGIPLREVPLTDSQRSVLDTVGVDSETFVITPAMQECVEAKLGITRMQEIIAGDAPTAVETVKLLPCLSVD